eukprot:CAMPEP_0113507826 /NCGR_PEP_ID=MMETSP0014_2-20120614/36676_1 /TAXON_ID=2857 /ORGANISM="Nitzschia sp." /LENGTH=548 /DNA_ID=CAMNT_0000403469 /DNA_START=28 /DNA_END=1674 /DNA_ORIENTATION=+ /assembly_acc=CAM_ASM_000159
MAEPTADSPFTPEQVAEWSSCGKKPAGNFKDWTDEQKADFKVMAAKRKEMLATVSEALKDNKMWTKKKIEAELDRLAEEAESGLAKPILDTLDGPSGTRDFYPAEMRVQNWLFDNFRQSAEQFGFQEYDAPVLEHVQLYERKAGEEIVDQMYAFVDKEGHRVTLRPEMTPTLARMVLNKTNLQTGEVRTTLPLKWFSIPQCWRFETTQRGRKREHYQWNMDIVGVDHVHAELELLAAACFFFQRVGIGPDIVGIKVNSRAILEAVLAKHGIEKGQKDASDGGDIFAKACVIIDKLDKIGGPAVTELLGEIGVSEDSSAEILKALEAPTVEELALQIGGENEAIGQVKRLFELANEYGIGDYLIFDASVVRGLAYYTGVVWEAFDRRGELRAIMGGGRYDRLLELYGGEKCQIPCVGFGFGDCVIMELLKEIGKVPDFSMAGPDYVVCALNPQMYGAAANISWKLRMLGKTVDLMPTPKKKVAASFNYADQTGAKRMVFVAPDEIKNGVVRIKDLRTKDSAGESIQVDCPLDALETADDLVAKAAAGTN